MGVAVTGDAWRMEGCMDNGESQQFSQTIDFLLLWLGAGNQMRLHGMN